MRSRSSALRRSTTRALLTSSTAEGRRVRPEKRRHAADDDAGCWTREVAGFIPGRTRCQAARTLPAPSWRWPLPLGQAVPSGAGGDSWVDRIHPDGSSGPAPCGDALLDAGLLCLAVAGMPQQGELRPCHDDDRPRACRARSITDRWKHRHRGTLVEEDQLSQFQRPETTNSCRPAGVPSDTVSAVLLSHLAASR